jgi:hypothetical protein
VRPTFKLVIALLGGVIYAAAGALIGSMNAGWLGLERNGNAVLPALGIGAALSSSRFSRLRFTCDCVRSERSAV